MADGIVIDTAPAAYRAYLQGADRHGGAGGGDGIIGTRGEMETAARNYCRENADQCGDFLRYLEESGAWDVSRVRVEIRRQQRRHAVRVVRQALRDLRNGGVGERERGIRAFYSLIDSPLSADSDVVSASLKEEMVMPLIETLRRWYASPVHAEYPAESFPSESFYPPTFLGSPNFPPAEELLRNLWGGISDHAKTGMFNRLAHIAMHPITPSYIPVSPSADVSPVREVRTASLSIFGLLLFMARSDPRFRGRTESLFQNALRSNNVGILTGAQFALGPDVPLELFEDDDRLVGLIAEGAHHRDNGVRWNAIELFYQMASRESMPAVHLAQMVPAVAVALGDSQVPIRKRAANLVEKLAIARLPQMAYGPIAESLANALEGEREPRVREAQITAAYEFLGSTHPSAAPQVFAKLIRLLWAERMDDGRRDYLVGKMLEVVTGLPAEQQSELVNIMIEAARDRVFARTSLGLLVQSRRIPEPLNERIRTALSAFSPQNVP